MDTRLLKKINAGRIRAALKEIEPASKISLAEATGLSVATCGNILTELIARGEVFEIENAASTGGRCSRQFVYNARYASMLAVYARKEGEEQSLHYAVANLYGIVVDSGSERHDVITADAIGGLIAARTAAYPNIAVVSIGIPGVVQDGVVGLCDIEALSGLNVARRLCEQTGLEVVLENDVNAAVCGLASVRGSEDDQSLAYVYYPVDGEPGTGLIVNGALLHGCTQFAGEVAYLPFEGGGGRLESAAKTLAAIACIIDPAKIAISGLSFTEADIRTIRAALAGMIPAPHVPDVIFEPDFHKSCVSGLIVLALGTYAAVS